jgi:signal transduction histidine kinase
MPNESSEHAQLSAQAAHELINLLGVVLANAQLASWADADHPARNELDEIAHAATQAVELVRGLSAAKASESLPDNPT